MKKSSMIVGPKVAATALTYKGPSRLPQGKQQNDLVVTQINNAGAVTASAGGVINTVFDSYAQASTPADWTNFANLYTEFRVLSMEIEFVPWSKYNQPTTSTLAPLYLVIDRSNNTVLGSVAQAVSYESCEVKCLSDHFKMVVKMNSAEEAQWTPVGSSPATASRMYLKLYSTGNTASLTSHDFVCRTVVQFRGRQ